MSCYAQHVHIELCRGTLIDTWDEAFVFPKRAAGVVCCRADGAVLLLRRSQSTDDHPGCWGLPAGAVDPGEGHFECAMRELREETGIVALPHELTLFWGSYNGNFCAYKMHLPIGSSVTLNGEHTEHGWFTPARLPAPAHKGLSVILRALPT